MRTNLNFSPLFRSTIGFDRVFDLLENANRAQSFESWPPYDIVRTSEDSDVGCSFNAGFLAPLATCRCETSWRFQFPNS